MRALILAFALILTNVLPVGAETALVRFDQALKAAGIPVTGEFGTLTQQGVKPANLRIDFAAGATAQQIADANALANSFDWLDQSDPNPKQFLITCTADGGIPANARLSLHTMALWYLRGEKQLALAIWNQLKNNLTAPQIVAIQGHATANQITLP